MLFFTDIVFNKDWVYADANDTDTRVNGLVKVSRHNGLFMTDCCEENNFQWGAYKLRDTVNEGKVKQSGELTIMKTPDGVEIL